MERTRFSDTLDLITGKFLRHSPEFYNRRTDNRLKRLESDSDNAAPMDNLAVAYDEIFLRGEKSLVCIGGEVRHSRSGTRRSAGAVE